MKIELEYPYTQDYRVGYLLTNRENRKMVCLIGWDDKRTTTAYARYLVSVANGRYLTSNEEADHVDGDKTNDSLDNLQILSRRENRVKSMKLGETLYAFVCPICGKDFELTASRRSHKNQPTCSRRCGGIKSHITKRQRLG